MIAKRALAGHRGIRTDGVHEAAPGVFAGRARVKYFVGGGIVGLDVVEVSGHFLFKETSYLGV